MSWDDDLQRAADEVNEARAAQGLPPIPAINPDGTDGAGGWAQQRLKAEAEAARMRAELAEQLRIAKVKAPGRSLEERFEDSDQDYDRRTGR